jgi:hypothetical protein
MNLFHSLQLMQQWNSMLCPVLIFIYNNIVTCEDTVVKTASIPKYSDIYSTHTHTHTHIHTYIHIHLNTINYVMRWINTSEQHSIIYSTHSIETRRHSNNGYSLNSSVNKQQKQQQSEHYCLSKQWQNLHTKCLKKKIYNFIMCAYNITFHIVYVHWIQPPFHTHNNSSVLALITTWILIKEVVQLFSIYSCWCNYELQVSLFLKQIIL